MVTWCKRPATLILAALLAGCAAPKAQGPLLLHPVPPTDAGYALSQGAVVFTAPEFTVSARPWDWRLVEEELKRSGEPSPFGPEAGDASRFLFIRVRIENRTAQRLYFNPLRAGLLRPGEAPIPPLENSDLFAFAGEEQREAETLARTFRRFCYDAAAAVPPGQTIERYLAFRAPEEAKLVTLELDDLWLGSKSFTLHFPFEAFPGK
jgi:hypothetical protein